MSKPFVPAWLQGQYGQQVQFPKDYRASLSPPTLGQMAQAAANAQAAQQAQAAAQGAPMHPHMTGAPTWQREQVYYPTPLLPEAPNLAKTPRDIVLRFTNQAVGQEIFLPLQVDIPGVIYAVSGGAYTTDDSNLPVGRDPLDTFLVRIERNNGDRLQTQAGLGSAVVGPARFPRLLGGPGYVFQRGASLRVAVTPLIANLDITICCWIMEIRGPTNISAVG
jgi:hypothetical protein